MTAPAIDSIATYGGVLADYRPVEDPLTERPASSANQAYGSVAAMTATAVRCFATLTGATGVAPTLVDHQSMWGNALPVVPVLGWTSTGLFTITWPASITDQVGTVQTLNLRRGLGFIEGATPGFITVTRTSANVLTVRTFSAAGTLSDLNGLTFTVCGL